MFNFLDIWKDRSGSNVICLLGGLQLIGIDYLASMFKL
jgi:hypothetical protein